MTGQEYVAVRFDRGAGLGTRMLPWARAVLYANDRGLPLLVPFWPRWTTSGLFRQGIDRRHFLRQISMLGVFQPPPRAIAGLEKLHVLSGAQCIREGDEAPSSDGKRDWVRIFSGPGALFADLNGRNQQLLAEFAAIVRPR